MINTVKFLFIQITSHLPCTWLQPVYHEQVHCKWILPVILPHTQNGAQFTLRSSSKPPSEITSQWQELVLSKALWGACKEQIEDHFSNFNLHCMSTITDHNSKTICCDLKELNTFYSQLEANNSEPHCRAIKIPDHQMFQLSTNDIRLSWVR